MYQCCLSSVGHSVTLYVQIGALIYFLMYLNNFLYKLQCSAGHDFFHPKLKKSGLNIKLARFFLEMVLFELIFDFCNKFEIYLLFFKSSVANQIGERF